MVNTGFESITLGLFQQESQQGSVRTGLRIGYPAQTRLGTATGEVSIVFESAYINP
jgi:glycine/serine hydroxymethyltransferase